jgi:acetyltransferase-like isoleucine patch superfamily enzyme
MNVAGNGPTLGGNILVESSGLWLGPCSDSARGLFLVGGASCCDSLVRASVVRPMSIPARGFYLPWNLTLGEEASIGEWALIYNLGPVTIGDRATISHRAHLCAGSHDYRDPALPLLRPPIEIGAQAWVCADAFIGPKVRVGEGAVVGAAAVVMRDVGDWEIVAGNPARVVKRRRLQ